MSSAEDYGSRIARELHHYASISDVHDLPEIYHYWSHTFIRPKLQAIGFNSMAELYTTPLLAICERRSQQPPRFLSLGAGNCDWEIDLAKTLRDSGQVHFTIDCLELNATMLERGAQAAAQASVSEYIVPLQADFNTWQAAGHYDGVIAMQSLHHVMNLEGLFTQIQHSLKPDGCFIVSDMIGRNGHERWPEALAHVRRFWRKLPPSYRYNWQLSRYEELFEDWNCAGNAFEGIRAQDILPLLLDRFHFERFVGYGNVIDPFVDRSFGPNFTASKDWDRAFIDEVHACDEQGIQQASLSPTHMLAVLSTGSASPTLCCNGLTPHMCLRRDRPEHDQKLASEDLEQDSMAGFPEHEVRIGRLLSSMESERRRLEQRLKAQEAEFEDQLKERTEWALTLEREVAARTTWALGLDREVAERTAWALDLDKHVAGLTERMVRMQQQIAHLTKPSFPVRCLAALKAKLRKLTGAG